MATNAWLGAALAVPQVDTVQLTGTWLASETISFTINGKTLTLTTGSGTKTEILDDIVAMLTGGTLSGGGSVNGYGNTLGEFYKLTVTEDGTDTATVTGPSDGQPFTMTVGETSSSGGVTHSAEATTATGPHHYSDIDNWSQAAVPGDGDTIVFDSRAAASLLYDMAQSATTPAKIIVADSLPSNINIGLPAVNKDNTSLPYNEYLGRYLVLGVSADAQKITVEMASSQCRRFNLDTNTAETELVVTATGQRAETAIPAMLWKGTDSSNIVNVSKGDVGIAFHEGEAATVATLRVSYLTSQTSDAKVYCGSGVTLTTATKSGGSLLTYSAMTTMTHSGGDWEHYDGNITTATISGGTMHFRGDSDTITTLNGYGGIADFSKDLRSRTVTNFNAHKGFTFKDPQDTVTLSNGIVTVGCSVEDLVLQTAAGKTWTPS